MQKKEKEKKIKNTAKEIDPRLVIKFSHLLRSHLTKPPFVTILRSLISL